MIEVELKDDQVKQRQLTPFLEKTLKAVTEIMQTSRLYQIVFRVFLVVEFLQVIYFSIGFHLNNMWNLSVFSYLVTLTSYLNFEQFIVNTNSQGFDSLLGLCLGLNGGAVLSLVMLPAVFVSKDKPVSGIGSLLVKMISLYMMAFNTFLIIPFMQLSYFGMQCDSSMDYYKGSLS